MPDGAAVPGAELECYRCAEPDAAVGVDVPAALVEVIVVPAAAPAVVPVAVAANYDHLDPDADGMPCWSRQLPPLQQMRRPAMLGWLEEPAHFRYSPGQPGIWGGVKRLTSASPFWEHGFIHMCIKRDEHGAP
jgi:DNA-binding helix-hairpin-helix protein with protein kinase domain